MRRPLLVTMLCLVALVTARDVRGQYLSTRSRPAAQNQPQDPLCYAHRRVEPDEKGVIVFTAAAEPTPDELTALNAAISAWNDAPNTSVVLEYGGVADGDGVQSTVGYGDCAAQCEMPNTTANVIELNSVGGQCPVPDTGDTVLANPGNQGAWNEHTYCGVKHWSIRGSRIRIAPGLSGAALARAIAHEIGMALGFAPAPALQPCNVLFPTHDVACGTLAYPIALGNYDKQALAAIYPAFQAVTLSAAESVCGDSVGNVASITNPDPAMTYRWVAHDGATIRSGQGTSSITFDAPPFGGYIICVIGPCLQQSMRVTVTGTKGCAVPGASPSQAVFGEATMLVGPAEYELSPRSANFPASGGTGSITVDAKSTCSGWGVTSNASFVTITSGSSGSGDGTVQYTVAANDSANARSTTITIAGRPIDITQSGAGRGTIALSAVASSASVALSWSTLPATAGYRVMRSSGSGFVQIGTTDGNLWSDTTVTPSVGYLYRITATNGAFNDHAHSNIDLAVPFSYVDPALASFVTPVRMWHFRNIRTAVDAARYALGWPSASFDGDIFTGGTILRSHLTDLRSQVNLVRSGAGLTPVAFTDPTATTIRAVHVLELRDALR